MRLPDVLREPLEATFEERQLGRILAAEPVGGGCIAETARVSTSTDRRFFLKWATGETPPRGVFSAEASSLAAIAETGAIRVPSIVDVRDPAHGEAAGDSGIAPRWLLLEWLEPGNVAAHTWTSLAGSLVDLHWNRSDQPGWPTDNFIGSLPQANEALPSWSDFWRERRLAPQVELAAERGLFDAAEQERFGRLYRQLDEMLAPADEDGMSLLHGDLWSGNVHVGEEGDASVIDPSCYFGHREVDLAMSQLFGGFDYLFYAAYEEAWPLATGYEDARRAVYQLYYLLVHVNLFGSGYRSRTLATLESLGF